MNVSARQPDTGDRSAEIPGIIDTIGTAFALLNRRPYLVWMPIALDVLLWSGLRVSLVDPLAGTGQMTAGTPGWVVEFVDAARRWMVETELVSLTGSLMPTLIDQFANQSDMSLGIGAEVQILGLTSSGLAVTTIFLTLLIGVSYLTIIGRLVSNQPAWGTRFLRDCLTNALRAVFAGTSIVTLLGFLLVPFALLGFGLHVVGIDPGTLLLIVALMLVGWALIFFSFSAHALALGQTDTLQALRSSYDVVRRNFLSVLGLFLVVLLIRAGTTVALQFFTESRWSVPFAIVANAYVATGLIAATMIYFHDRSADSLITPTAPNAVGASV